MENLSKLNNKELIQKIDILSQNHEQVKQEILMLHEVLVNIEDQYLKLTSELTSRK